MLAIEGKKLTDIHVKKIVVTEYNSSKLTLQFTLVLVVG